MRALEEDATAAKARLRKLNAKYREFSEAAGLPEQRERSRVISKNGEDLSRRVKRANNAGEKRYGNAEIVRKLDFSDKKAVTSCLEKAEEELSGLEYEVNYSVTSDGKVWRVSGEASTIDLSGIASSLVGSYSYHNYPRKQTYYSFSASDVAFFISNKEEYSKASDHVFEYVMRRTNETVEKNYEVVYHRFREIYAADVMKMEWDGIIDPDIDEYHEIMRILSRELKFDYARRKKGK